MPFPVKTVKKSNRKIVESGKINTPNRHIYITVHPSCLGKASSIKGGTVKLVLWAHILVSNLGASILYKFILIL